MAGSKIELTLSAEDKAALANEIVEFIRPHLTPADAPMFWSEQKVADWLGISRALLSQLRHAGVITPEREVAPIGYAAGSRQKLVEIMSNGPEWVRAKSISRKLYKPENGEEEGS